MANQKVLTIALQ